MYSFQIFSLSDEGKAVMYVIYNIFFVYTKQYNIFEEPKRIYCTLSTPIGRVLYLHESNNLFLNKIKFLNLLPKMYSLRGSLDQYSN